MLTFKNSLLFVLFICSISVQSIAQCPEADELYFSTQQELIDFKNEFPNCKDYEGSLILSNEDVDASEMITSLSPLSDLRFVNVLTIKNDSLGGISSLDGLSSLERLTYLIISELASIENLSGLERLDTLQNLNISHCPKLVDFEGLTEVQMFFNNSTFNNSLILRDNPLLEQISGFTIPERSFEVQLIDNPVLKSFGDLNSLSWGTICRIKGMNDLSFLNNLELTSLLEITGNENIQDLSFLESFDGANDLILYDFPNLMSLEEIEGTYLWSSIVLDNCGVADVEGIRLREPKQFQFFGSNLPLLSDISILEGHRELRAIQLQACPSLEDLEALNGLEVIQYYLMLDTLVNLRSLEDLSSLREIGRDCRLAGNPLLENLYGLSMLNSIGHSFYISDNGNLLSLQGLNGLENVGIRVEVKDNPNLESLDGLENFTSEDLLTSNAYFYIENNPELKSILGIRNCNPQFLYRISNNPKLSYCAIPPVCFALTNSQSYVIDNKLGCNFKGEVFNDCQQNEKLIKVFFDDNQNGLFDPSEVGIRSGQFNYDNQFDVFPNALGELILPVTEQGKTLEYTLDDCWYVTTNNESSVIDFFDLDPIYLGLAPTTEKHQIIASMSYGPIICDQEYLGWCQIENVGTQVGNYNIRISTFGDYVESSIAPEFIQDTLQFSFEDIYPGQQEGFWVKFLAPSVDEYPLGSDIEFEFKVFLDESGSETLEHEQKYSFEFKCAYDPNDKSVFPQGEGIEGLTKKEETLEFMIRFQNTGNYVAKDVVILDTLSSYLDLSSFEVIGASHELTKTQLERNYLSFAFNEIYLPDSVSNEALSHGYVHYRIKPKTEVPEEAVVENTAYIYFDSNPPIKTNTTLNTLVDQITSLSENEEVQFSIYPNPANEYVNFSCREDQLGKSYKIVDLLGRIRKEGKVSSMHQAIELEGLSPGIYLFQIDHNMVQWIKG